jgi:hypothetical protein
LTKSPIESLQQEMENWCWMVCLDTSTQFFLQQWMEGCHIGTLRWLYHKCSWSIEWVGSHQVCLIWRASCWQLSILIMRQQNQDQYVNPSWVLLVENKREYQEEKERGFVPIKGMFNEAVSCWLFFQERRGSHYSYLLLKGIYQWRSHSDYGSKVQVFWGQTQCQGLNGVQVGPGRRRSQPSTSQRLMRQTKKNASHKPVARRETLGLLFVMRSVLKLVGILVRQCSCTILSWD